MPRPTYPIIMASFLLLLSILNGASPALVNPLGALNFSSPVPVGIVSYGLYNISNDSGAYRIETNSIVGFARIDSIHAYNASPPANTSATSASLQLNVVLNITATNGNRFSYWIQDVADLNTSNMTYAIGDNIWNMTGLNASVTNGTVSAMGSSVPIGSGSSPNATFYVFFPNTTVSYSYPLYFIPVVSVKLAGGRPFLQIGYQQTNGTETFYDNVTFNISAASAHFLVTPYHLTPAPANGTAQGNFYDAELVFGGEANGESSTFSNTSALLWIGYSDNGILTPFPAVADFGSDTVESATGLAVGQNMGNAYVAQGNLDYNQTIYLSGIPGILKSPGYNAISTATAVPYTNAATGPRPNLSQTADNASSAGSSPQQSLLQEILGAISNFFMGLFGHL